MLKSADLIVLVSYLTAVVGLGLWFARRSGDTEAFMAADRSLPGWAIGLSMFGSYISSISFLANPGQCVRHELERVRVFAGHADRGGRRGPLVRAVLSRAAARSRPTSIWRRRFGAVGPHATRSSASC